MNWKSRDVIPPLAPDAVADGTLTERYTIKIIMRHKSGKISQGYGYLYNGKVAYFYSYSFNDMGCTNEPKDPSHPEYDPVLEWIECPEPTQIVSLMHTSELMRELADKNDDE